MAETAAVIASVVLALLGLFQLFLAAGRPWGRLAWGGSHVVLPTRLRMASTASVFLYALIAFVLLDRARVIDWLQDGVATPAAWVLVGYFALGILLNAISRSRPERMVMTPVVAILGATSLLVALGP